MTFERESLQESLARIQIEGEARNMPTTASGRSAAPQAAVEPAELVGLPQPETLLGIGRRRRLYCASDGLHYRDWPGPRAERVIPWVAIRFASVREQVDWWSRSGALRYVPHVQLTDAAGGGEIAPSFGTHSEEDARLAVRTINSWRRCYCPPTAPRMLGEPPR